MKLLNLLCRGLVSRSFAWRNGDPIVLPHDFSTAWKAFFAATSAQDC